MSREAAQRINITTEFSYTTDMLIQAGRKRLAITSVPVRTHSATRPFAALQVDSAFSYSRPALPSFAPTPRSTRCACSWAWVRSQR